MDTWKRALTVNQAALEMYRTLSDQQLYELFAAEKAQHDSYDPAYPTHRRKHRDIMDSRDRATYLGSMRNFMALQAAILERPSAASHPDFQSLVAMQRRGCYIAPAGIVFLVVMVAIAGALIYSCVMFT